MYVAALAAFAAEVAYVFRATLNPSAQRPARYVDNLAGDEARVLADQEGDSGRHVGRLADPVYGYLLLVGLHELLERHLQAGGHVRGHVGGDEVRRDRVRGDPELAQFLGERLGEALHAGLGGGVVGLPAVAERR